MESPKARISLRAMGVGVIVVMVARGVGPSSVSTMSSGQDVACSEVGRQKSLEGLEQVSLRDRWGWTQCGVGCGDNAGDDFLDGFFFLHCWRSSSCAAVATRRRAAAAEDSPSSRRGGGGVPSVLSVEEAVGVPQLRQRPSGPGACRSIALG
ncbi:unnamed protein product [Closterium sp. NIES-65]|nr:unnamed protein product [Closterium sp. NIES-65]